MKHLPTLKRPARTATVALAAAAATAALTIPGLALARGDHGGSVPPPPASPTSDSQIQNLDQVKTAIKAYYGDTLTTDARPRERRHHAAPDVADRRLRPADRGHRREGRAASWRARPTTSRCTASTRSSGTPAILFDIDDTTLNTYSYEIYSSFVYNPTTNAAFVNAGSASVFPAVPGMIGPRGEGDRRRLPGVLPDRPIPARPDAGHPRQPRRRRLHRATPATSSSRTPPAPPSPGCPRARRPARRRSTSR